MEGIARTSLVADGTRAVLALSCESAKFIEERCPMMVKSNFSDSGMVSCAIRRRLAMERVFRQNASRFSLSGARPLEMEKSH